MGLLREIFRLNCHGNLLTELLYIDLGTELDKYDILRRREE